jgi:hypothetical protein
MKAAGPMKNGTVRERLVAAGAAVLAALVTGAVAGAALSGCTAARPARAMVPDAASPTGTSAPTGTPTPSPTGSPAGAGWPPFAWSVGPLSAARLGRSWHRGCPVGPAGLRLLRVRYAGFDGAAHGGELVVAAGVTREVAAIFAELYRMRFPVRQLRTVDAYGGSDGASMAADNTSAFNCRPVTGGTAWSAHAYGRAIDVNPRENPYLSGRTVLPPGARTDRSRAAPGMVTPAVVAAFARHGWTWGGTWTAPIDYQHFERR